MSQKLGAPEDESVQDGAAPEFHHTKGSRAAEASWRFSRLQDLLNTFASISECCTQHLSTSLRICSEPFRWKWKSQVWMNVTHRLRLPPMPYELWSAQGHEDLAFLKSFFGVRHMTSKMDDLSNQWNLQWVIFKHNIFRDSALRQQKWHVSTISSNDILNASLPCQDTPMMQHQHWPRPEAREMQRNAKVT